jgi:hypothetical protein
MKFAILLILLYQLRQIVKLSSYHCYYNCSQEQCADVGFHLF